MCKFCEPTTLMFKDYHDKDEYIEEVDGGNPEEVLGRRVKVCHPIAVDCMCSFSATEAPMPVDCVELGDREIWIENGNELCATNSGSEYYPVHAQINFCPMCGRPLNWLSDVQATDESNGGSNV